ncbi:MAG TPA: T9SS type A sorting domain-containing protein [Chitinophagales bacterium]|nr:T9SS type A sorting domain-containing protein [Chitinophagales bacterium]
MKHTLLLLCLVWCYGFNATAQSSNFPFPTQNAYWSYAYISCVTTDICFQSGMLQYVIAGDSVVNGITYQKYYSSNDSIFDLNQATLVALFREDLATRRSYVLEPSEDNPNILEEHLRYDFSVEVGDTVDVYIPTFCMSLIPETGCIPVAIVKEVSYADDGRKIIRVGTENFSAEWIEGIGNPTDLFHQICPCGLFCEQGFQELLCVEDNGNNIYKKYDNNSCYQVPGSVGIHNNALLPLNLRPNPSDNWVRVSLPQTIAAPQGIVQITDLQAKVVQQWQVNAANTAIQLPTTDLPNGMYFVQYIADRQVRAVARLVVQH